MRLVSFAIASLLATTIIAAPPAAPSEKAPPSDPTQTAITDLIDKIEKEVTRIGKLDTQQKRDSANAGMLRDVAADFHGTTLSYQAKIKDVKFQGSGTSLAISDLQPVEGLDNTPTKVVLPISRADADKINAGDILTITGRAVLQAKKSRTATRRSKGVFQVREGVLIIGSWFNPEAQAEYSVGIANPKSTVTPKKPK